MTNKTTFKDLITQLQRNHDAILLPDATGLPDDQEALEALMVHLETTRLPHEASWRPLNNKADE